MIQIVLSRPVFMLNWGEDRPVAEGQDVPRQVLLDLYPPGYENLVLGSNAHKAFVKGPVAQAAEGKPVRGLVVAALAPGLDVGRLDDRMAVRREHPDSAQRTTVIINTDNRFPESLVPDPDTGFGFLGLLPPPADFGGRQMREQTPAVLLGTEVYGPLVDQGNPDVGGKVSVDQGHPQLLTRLRLHQKLEQIIIQSRTGTNFREPAHGTEVHVDLRFETQVGDKMPESVAFEPWERIGHIPPGPGWHDPSPVKIEGLHQFHGWLYEVFRDLALNNKVHNRKEDERLVGCLKTGDGGPPLPVLVRPQIPEHPKVFFKHRIPR
jgi:hypothetical protein